MLRLLLLAQVLNFTVPGDLTSGLQEYPLHQPGRPFIMAAFHHVHARPDWFVGTVLSGLDIVTDAGVSLERPSLVGPDAIATANPALTVGLYTAFEGGGTHEVENAAQAARTMWLLWHGEPVPPVYVYLTAAQQTGSWRGCCPSVYTWMPEWYWPLQWPAEPQQWMFQHIVRWDAALGFERPILPAVQFYDRNGVHAARMKDVFRFAGLWMSACVMRIHCLGLAAFAVNRPGGMFTYPFMGFKFQQMAMLAGG